MHLENEIASLFRQRVAAHPDETWLRFEEETFSWSQALELGLRAAHGYVNLGLRPGEHLAIMGMNKVDWVWAYLGGLLMGARVVPVNARQRGLALEYMLADSGSVLLVVDDDLQDLVPDLRRAAPALRTVVTFGSSPATGTTLSFDEMMVPCPVDSLPSAVEPVPGAVSILYTSGTSGPPKGIGADNYEPPLSAVRVGVQPGDTMYTCLPLFHGNALLLSLVGSIRLDAGFALAPRFSASGFWDDIRRSDAVQTNLIGGMANLLLKQPPRPDDADNPLRVIVSGGACAESRREEFQTRFGVRLVEYYGMSDSPGWVLNLDGPPGAVGKAVGGAEYRIVDDLDAEVARGTVGSIVFRYLDGPVTHYHNQPELTAEAYRGGWFHSGDLGRMDDDGYLYFVGRKVESMRRKGENISPWEVEGAFLLDPAVVECAAYQVEVEGQAEVMVSLVLSDDVESAAGSVIREAVGRLADYARPRFVDVVVELPKNEMQKVQRRELTARGVSASAVDVPELLRSGEGAGWSA